MAVNPLSRREVMKFGAFTTVGGVLTPGISLAQAIVTDPKGLTARDIQLNVGGMIRNHVKQGNLGRATVESGVLTELGPDTVRGPDVAYWSFERLPPDQTPVVFANVAPDLVAEVVSPSNSRKDIARKVREYFAGGVPGGHRRFEITIER